MERSAFVLALVIGATSLALVGEREAAACGGCFTPPKESASDITDERMLLSVSPLQSTLYDQIRYAGNPSAFAWVLPIHGTVDVGLSADVLFDSVDILTQTQIQQPPSSCTVPTACQRGGSPFASATGAQNGASDNAGGGAVTVTKQQNVGPYATVQLHTTDPMALNTWLLANGFNIPADVQPVIDEYVREGFDFLALKLLPGQGVQSMRPVRVTTPGASLTLPLRMAAIGTGATVGITIWVVADGRYEPQNFPSFHIDDSKLVWDWSARASNYTTLRQQNEQALGGKGWEMESSLNLGEDVIRGVITNGGTYYGGYYQGTPSDATQDYLPSTWPDGRPESADEVRTADINALFAGMVGPQVRVTRMRSDIAHAAMTTDFVLQASADQSEMPRARIVSQSINETCPIYGGTCQVVGTGTPEQAAASGPHGTGGCTTSSASNDAESPIGLVAVAGMLGLAAIRTRRLRRRT
jgi:MYXO-CTERM domain-containing protein